MSKFYVVKKDTPLWKQGAILHRISGGDGYEPINKTWNVAHANNEYLSSPIIENNPEWFEEVRFLEGFGYLRASEFGKLAKKLGISILPEKRIVTEDE